MAIMVAWKESGALRKRVKDFQDAVQPDSWRMDQLRTALKKITVADNTEKMLGYGSSAWAGIDRFGVDLAPPADATIRSWPGKLGRVLAPHGLASRTITAFRVRWVFDGTAWRLVAGWVGIPWMIYHLKGCPKGSKASQPNWSLPRRDVGGTSPKGWVQYRATFHRFVTNLVKSQAA